MSVSLWTAMTDAGSLDKRTVLRDDDTGRFFGTGFYDPQQARRFLNWLERRNEDPWEVYQRGLWTDALFLFGEATKQERVHPLDYCRERYCFGKEAHFYGQPSGWGVCRKHAARDDGPDLQKHAEQCPGCDECGEETAQRLWEHERGVGS